LRLPNHLVYQPIYSSALSPRSYAYFTFRIACLSILNSPNPSEAFLVSYSVHTPNTIGDKHHTFLTPLPILLTCLECEQEP